MFYHCVIQYGSPQPRVALEHWNDDQETEFIFFITIHCNLNNLPWLMATILDSAALNF